MTVRAKPVSNRPPVPVFISFGLKQWHGGANCRNHPHPDIFYTKSDWPEAKDVCAGCPVAVDCLDELADDPHCVAGGLDPDERSKMRRRVSRHSGRRRALAILDDDQWHSFTSVVQYVREVTGVSADTARSTIYRALKQQVIAQRGTYDLKAAVVDTRQLMRT